MRNFRSVAQIAAPNTDLLEYFAGSGKQTACQVRAEAVVGRCQAWGQVALGFTMRLTEMRAGSDGHRVLAIVEAWQGVHYSIWVADTHR